MTRPVDTVDAVVCDLDGVVITGSAAVEHAVPALAGLPVPVVFATNNASRTPEQVGDHLRSLGVQVTDGAIITSSVAAARELSTQLPAGAPVLAVGGEGVSAALRAVGLAPRGPEGGGEVAAVVQGYGPQVTAADLAAVAAAIRSGARWIATNDDLTLPTADGPAPGNGSLVQAVRNTVTVDPEVMGKPHPPIYALAAAAVGATPERTLAVGDRLETDIAGACATGMPSALVLTGVHGPADAAAAPPRHRPTHVLPDLRGLTAPYPRAEADGSWSVRGAARARFGEGLETHGEGIDAVRVALDVLWAAVDAGRVTSGEARRLMSTR